MRKSPIVWRLSVAVVVSALWYAAAPHAQAPRLHLNPAIEKLAKGEPFIGVSTGDLSLENARTLARAPIDYVYVDMEHTPLNLDALHMFHIGMTDRAAILKKGNLQPNVALFARFPPEADQSAWVVKQALDIGLMGVIFNGVENKVHALAAVQSMRYPQLRGSKYYEPVGKRGAAPTLASWIWGLNADEYEAHADLWPLNPDGDLLAIVMVESVDGLRHLDEILSVPGIGAVFIGNANDLRHSLGVPASSPEVEAARQTILKACFAHNVACGVTVNSGADMVTRLKEGWRMIRATVETIREGRALQDRARANR
jgi:4-hydroxy-2-oxoheptanedioate aldolase